MFLTLVGGLNRGILIVWRRSHRIVVLVVLICGRLGGMGVEVRISFKRLIL
jgi:hypothetical protein